MRRLLLVPRYRVPSTPLSIISIYLAAGYGIWQGVGILTSAPQRFTSPALQIVGQHRTAWGLVALLCGITILYAVIRHHFRLKAVGLCVLSGWSLTFASAALNTYLTNPTAGPTGPPAYYFIGAMLAVLVWVDDKRRVSAVIDLPPTR